MAAGHTRTGRGKYLSPPSCPTFASLHIPSDMGKGASTTSEAPTYSKPGCARCPPWEAWRRVRGGIAAARTPEDLAVSW
eukprot:3269974-Pyramimonas_sp.AAC.1